MTPQRPRDVGTAYPHRSDKGAEAAEWRKDKLKVCPCSFPVAMGVRMDGSPRGWVLSFSLATGSDAKPPDRGIAS